MKYIFKTICLVGLLLSLGSCAFIPISYPTNATISAHKFPAPTNEQAMSKIMSRIYLTYKDPDSVIIRDFEVGSFGAIDLSSGIPLYGYKVSFSMNARNGTGAYNGYHRYSYLVTQGGAVEIFGVELSSSSFQFYPVERYFFYTESVLRSNAPDSKIPSGS